MKRHTLIILATLIAIFFQTAITQNGYKNFRWGDTIEQVSAKTEGWEASIINDKDCFTIAYALDRTETPDRSIPDPLDKIEGRVTWYRAKNPDAYFIFVDSKLVAVTISFYKEYVISDLEKKYGATKKLGLRFGPNHFETRAWFNDANRIITYARNYEAGWDSELTGYERVCYISRKTYTWLKGMILEEEKAKKSKTRSRID